MIGDDCRSSMLIFLYNPKKNLKSREGVKSPISSCSFKIGLGYSAYVVNIKEWNIQMASII